MPVIANHSFWMSLLLLFCGATLPSAMAADAGLTLVHQGQGRAELIVSPAATTTEQLAAQEFQLAVKQITGATLPIVSQRSGAAVGIVLGTPASSDAIARHAGLRDDLAFLGDTDGFAIRLDGQVLLIAGNQPGGVLNGVHSFLEENGSILWFRAGEAGTAYTASPDFIATRTDYREKPAYTLRGWHLVYRHVHDATEMWMSRNRLNYKPTPVGQFDKLRPELTRRGIHTIFGSGHNLGYWIPAKELFESHPEYFAQIDGVRRPLGAHSQLCFSNEALRDLYARHVVERIKTLPDDVKRIGIFINDNWNVCQCDACTAPITLPDGQVIEHSDNAFRSTQFFQFINPIAQAVADARPGTRVMTFAYIFSAIPPRVSVNPHIDVLFCPFVKSDKHTLDSDINRKWLDRIITWTKMTDHLTIYEYYTNAGHYPRSLARTVQADLKTMRDLGIGQLYSELHPDMDIPHRDPAQARRLSHVWDVSAMQFWLISRLLWNPDADLAALTQRYLDRVYGPAAPAMGRYFKQLEDSWYTIDDAEHYNAVDFKLAERYIQQPGLTQPLTALLDQAAAQAGDGVYRQRVLAMRSRFDAWMAQIAKNPAPELVVPVASSSPADALDFTLPVWQNAAVIDGFKVMKKPDIDAADRTVIRVLRDADHLYVGVEAFQKDPAHAPTGPAHEHFPAGDRIELFIDGDQTAGYYHLTFNAAGVRYDGRGYDKSWNGPWAVKTQNTDQGWSAVAVIPWQTLGVKPEAKDVGVLFYRYRDVPDQPAASQSSSWIGGDVHSKAALGKLILTNP